MGLARLAKLSMHRGWREKCAFMGGGIRFQWGVGIFVL
jgi:hypothetical protein